MLRFALVCHVPYTLDSYFVPLASALAQSGSVDLYVPEEMRTTPALEHARRLIEPREDSIEVIFYPGHAASRLQLARSFRTFRRSTAHLHYSAAIFHVAPDPPGLLMLNSFRSNLSVHWYLSNHLLLQNAEFANAFFATNDVRFGLGRIHTAYRSKAARQANAGNRIFALLRTAQITASDFLLQHLPTLLVAFAFGLGLLLPNSIERKTQFPAKRGDLVFVNSPLAREIERQLNPGVKVVVVSHPCSSDSSEPHEGGDPGRDQRMLLLFAGDDDLPYLEDISGVAQSLHGGDWVDVRPHPNASVSSIDDLAVALQARGLKTRFHQTDLTLRQVLEDLQPHTVLGTPSTGLYDCQAMAPRARIVGIWPQSGSARNQDIAGAFHHPTPFVRMGENYPTESGIAWVGSSWVATPDSSLRRSYREARAIQEILLEQSLDIFDTENKRDE